MALLVSARLQRFITDPVFNLAQTARIIAERRDYSVRAKKLSRDEFGLLTDAVAINASSLEKSGISVEYQLAEIPPLLLDTVKLEQILVNLIRNAQEAVMESGWTKSRSAFDPAAMRTLSCESRWPTTVPASLQM